MTLMKCMMTIQKLQKWTIPMVVAITHMTFAIQEWAPAIQQWVLAMVPTTPVIQEWVLAIESVPTPQELAKVGADTTGVGELTRENSQITTTPKKIQTTQKNQHIRRPRLHEAKYLGLTIDYRTRGKLKIFMFNYIKKLIDDLPTDMKGKAKTPVAYHLFMTNQECKKLPESMVQLFLHLVAKLLYLCRCTRHDIQMTVAFLCTQVTNPDTDDYKTLVCLMQYLRGTQELRIYINFSLSLDFRYIINAYKNSSSSSSSLNELKNTLLIF